MKRFIVLLSTAVMLLMCCSCAQYKPLSVPGHGEFEGSLKSEYDYISSIKCVIDDPTTYSVRVKIKRNMEPEDMSGLIEVLMDYATTSALEAYKGIYEGNPDFISLEFYVNSDFTIHFSYGYSLTSRSPPEWKRER